MTHSHLFLAALALVACHKPDASAESKKASPVALAPVSVHLGDVVIQPMPKYLTLTGSVQADRQSEVAANVSGRVTATYVERGMPVKQGQVLAVVDKSAAGYQAAAAQAQSQVAQTQVLLAKQECERADTLFTKGALPKAEYDRLKTQCTAQLYQANAAQANADLAGKLAGDTVIRAPIDGFIGERYVSVGEYVQPPTKVASVYAINPARVTISVPEAAVGLVKEGQSINLEVSSYPGKVFPATVRFLSPALRSNTRDLIVEAQARNDESSLRPGMFATVRLTVGEEEVPTVPLEAVKVDGTVRRIFLARNNVAYEVVARTGVTKDGRIAVLESLNANDKVVLTPPPNLFDASPITPGKVDPAHLVKAQEEGDHAVAR